MSKKHFLQFLEKTIQGNCHLSQMDMGNGRVWALLSNFTNWHYQERSLNDGGEIYWSLKDVPISWMPPILGERGRKISEEERAR